MANEWMPIQEDLHTDIAVLRIARQTGLDPDSVVGKLIRVWKWARLNSPDGFMPGTIAADADDVAKHDGFCAAMVAAGWLEVTAEGLVFPKWDVWNSGGARRRLLEQRKKAAQRASKADVPQLSRSCPDDVPQMSRSHRDKSGTREEKRREEEKKTEREIDAGASESPPPVKPDPPNDGESLIPEIWRLYPRKEGKGKALKAIRAAIGKVAQRNKGDPYPRLAAAAWILDRVRTYAASPSVTTNDPKFLPHPATWFNDERFDDDDTHWKQPRPAGERSGGRGSGGAGGGHPGQASAGTRSDQARAARVAGEFADPNPKPPVMGPKSGVLRARLRRDDGAGEGPAPPPSPDRPRLEGADGAFAFPGTAPGTGDGTAGVA